jgi:hypothetical protein
MVRRAGLPERQARVRRYHLDVEVLVADVGVHLVERAHRGKDGERGDVGDEPGLGHAGRHAEHVLLGYADVEETPREFIAEHADLRRLGQVGRQAYYLGMLVAQVAQGLPVYLRRRHLGRVEHGKGHAAHFAVPFSPEALAAWKRARLSLALAVFSPSKPP